MHDFKTVKKILKFIPSLIGLEIRKRSELDRFLFTFNSATTARFLYFKRMLEKVSDTEGDIVECGVGKAKSFQMLSFLLEQSRDSQRVLWGFDSFTGFPAPTAEDHSLLNTKEGDWNYLSHKGVLKILHKTRINPRFINSQIRLVEGFFEETLPKYKIKSLKLILCISTLICTNLIKSV